MNINLRSIETFVVRLPARADFRWLSLSRPLGEFVLARVVAEDDTEGWGEIVALRDWGDRDGRRHGETPATVRAIVHEQLAPALLGNEVPFGALTAHLDALVVGNPYAKALIDIAAHDLVGRARGVPVSDLLGGAARTAVPVAHMIGLMEQDQAMAEAEAAIEDGVKALQVKGGADLERDTALIRDLRLRLGHDVNLRLDANGGYRSRAEACRAVAALADAGVDTIEQPTLGLDALRAARSVSPVPIIADESCWTPADALSLCCAGTVDALSVYVGKAGGLASARTVTAVARAAGLPHDVNGALEAGIGNAANLHLALSSPAELLPCVVPVNAPGGRGPTSTAGRYFDDDVITSPLPYRDGCLEAPDGPGLGVEIDLEKVERYTVAQQVST